MNGIDWKVLTPKDAEAFHTIRILSLRTDPESYIRSLAEEERESLESIARRICNTTIGSEKFVVGAYVEKKLIGTSAFYREEWENLRHKGELWGVYVKQEFRNQGIARQLVSRTIELSKSIDGIEQINLEVSGSMQKKFYESLGFVSWGIEKNCTKLDNRSITWDHMSLVLK